MTAADNQGLQVVLGRLHGVEQTGPNSWVTLCPLHDDHRPSLHIDIKLKDQRPHPFIWCNSCGGVFSELLTYVRVSPSELYVGLAIQSTWIRPERPLDRPLKSLADSHCEIVRRAHVALLDDGDRLRWLRDVRGLDTATVEMYRLGYWNGYQVPVYEEGVLVNRRVYSPPDDSGCARQPKWKGIQGAGRSLYPDPAGMRDKTWILLVEGELDALVARQHDLPAWTQTAGASSTLHPAWERYFSGKNVAMCYDVDAAGRAGARRVAGQLLEWACNVRIVNLGLGDGEDITDHFVKFDRSAGDLLQLVKQSTKFTESNS